MSVTTEEIELLAQTHDLVRFTLGMKAPEHDLTAAALRSLAAERDALKAENANLQDDLASAERERAHQQGRADRNAAEYAREQKKREQLQAENAHLRAECDALPAKVERPESGVSYEAFVSAMQIVTTERDALKAELDQAVSCIEDAKAEREQLQTENARLKEARRLGIDAVEFWAAYASPYFQDKHDLAEDLQKLRASLGETQ